MSRKEEGDSIDVLSKSLAATAEELDSLLRQARRHVEGSHFVQSFGAVSLITKVILPIVP